MRILLLLSLCFIGACAEFTPASQVGKGTQEYTEFIVTNAHGDLVAAWIAEGRYRLVEGMYYVKAVERRLPPPEELVFKYPNGRAAIITGQNIVYQKVPKPAWLEAKDAE